MRIETKIWGVENNGEYSQDLMYLNSKLSLKVIKNLYIKKILNDIEMNLEDINNKKSKQKFKKEFIEEIEKFVIEQYLNFNLYTIKNVTEQAMETEIIKIDVEDKIKEVTNEKTKKLIEKYKGE